MVALRQKKVELNVEPKKFKRESPKSKTKPSDFKFTVNTSREDELP